MTDIDIRSKELLTSITDGLDFSVPSVDFDSNAFKIPESLADALKNTPEQLTIGTLTDCTIDGNGCFDKVMTTLKAHLNLEYEAGRITGAEYTKAYIASMQGALQISVQYLLGKDNAYFTSLGSQATALRANIDAYTAKVQLAIAQAQAHQNKAEYANKVLALSATDTQRDLVIEQAKQVIAQTALTGVQEDLTSEQVNTQVNQTQHLAEQTKHLVEQIKHTTAQTALTTAQKDIAVVQKDLTTEQVKTQVNQTVHLAKQTDHLNAQTELIGVQTDVAVIQKDLITEQVETQKNQTKHIAMQTMAISPQMELVKAQTEVQKQQKGLLLEQTEQAHAQVSDTQLDGSTPVTGYTGNQNKLLKQQVEAFKHDAIVKGSKIFTDSFATQLSMSTATVSGTGLDAQGIAKATAALQASIAKQAS